MQVSKNLQKNIDEIDKRLQSDDIEKISIDIKKKKACLVFAREIVNKEALGELILRPLSNYKGKIDEDQLFSIFLSPEKNKEKDLNEVLNEISFGNTVLFIDGLPSAFSFGLKKFEKRG